MVQSGVFHALFFFILLSILERGTLTVSILQMLSLKRKKIK